MVVFYRKLVILYSYRFLQKRLSDIAKSLDDIFEEKGIYPYEYITSL